MVRIYSKEEEFLDEFYDWASVAVLALKGAWCPNYSCDDKVRKRREYFLLSGELSELVFMSASSRRNGLNGLEIEINLQSSTRVVNMKVSQREGLVVAENISDYKK